MKTLTTRYLNRHTASVLDALERGESFELRRNGHAVGYLTRAAPRPRPKSDWKAHFANLRRRPIKNDARLLKEFEESRRRLAAREKVMGNVS